MRYISIALSAEGPTDEAFLWPIIYRTAHSLATSAVIQEAPHFIERSGNPNRIRRICDRADQFDVFVVHSDATRAALPRITETIIQAVRSGVEDCGIEANRVVGLVTVAEMESWPLASPDAIARSLGFQSWPARLKLSWDPAQVETISDPKQVLSLALLTLMQQPLDRETLHETLEAIGNAVPLDALGALPSFRAFRNDLRTCLLGLRAA